MQRYRLLKNQCYGKACVLCHGSIDSGVVCQSCEAIVFSLQMPHSQCQYCNKILSHAEEMLICGQCQQKEHHYQAIWSSFHYQEPLSRLLHTLKFQQQIAWASILAKWMLQAPPPWLQQVEIDTIVPVPLSNKRLYTRGFNQSFELANVLAKEYCLPINSSLIGREHRVAQSQLSAKKRQLNVKNAFEIQPAVKNRKLLLIDDVVTTHATVSEIAQNLKHMGAEAVYVWVLLSG